MTAQRIVLRIAAATTLVALFGCQSALSAQSDQSPAYTVVATAGNAGQIVIPIPSSPAVSNANSAQEAGYEISPADEANANAPQPRGDAWAWQAVSNHAHN